MRSTRTQRAASWAGLGLLVFASAAPAQYNSPHQEYPPTPAPAPKITYHKKPAAVPVSASAPTPLVPAFDLQPVALQQPAERVPGAIPEESLRLQIQLEPPGNERLFLLESEKALFERMRLDALERSPPERIVFPTEPVVSLEKYQGRHWPPMNVVVEPNYVCYRRLLFEQRSAERYGWDLGPFHPILSMGEFVADAFTLPYHLGTAPCRKYDCSAGLCLPGDPVPLLLYPPEISTTGLLAQGVALGTLLVLFP